VTIGSDDALGTVLDGLTARFSGRAGYVFTNLTTGERIARDEHVEFPTASTIKLPILTALHEHARRTGMDWDERIPVTRSEVAAGSGILQYLSRELELSYRDLAWLMICLSDNTATNLLLDAVGRERISEILAEVVNPAIRLLGRAGAGFETRYPSMGYATPAALGDYLNRLAERSLPGAGATIAVAEQQVYESMIPRYLARSPGATIPLTVAHKTGALPGVRADIGLVSAASTTITVCVMTADANDRGYDTLHEGGLYIGAVTYAVCRAWLGVSSAAGDRDIAAALACDR
jgi:beta-lactamase class A